jgi:superfamily II RNA helicase
MKVLCLSATIPNIRQFASWLESIHSKTVKVVIEETRPVPLSVFFQCHDHVFEQLSDMKHIRDKHPNKLTHLIRHVAQKDGLPCIYFVFGRRRAEELAFELYNYDFLSSGERQAMTSLYEDLCSRFDLKGEKSAERLRPLIAKGIAYHHAGMLPTLKEAVERLFTSRLLKVIFTTETFALGINMPSRSVVFDDLKKIYGRFVMPLKTRDFYQMAGRAGRRGMDKEGFVYCRINPHRISPDEIRRAVYGRPEAVMSQFNTSYATVLNLYERHGEECYSVYPLSLHYFQSRPARQKEALRLMEAKLNVLKDLNHIDRGRLTAKGDFAKVLYGYELLLSELYARGLFEELDEFGLAVMAVGAVFEPRKNQTAPSLSKLARRLKYAADEVFEGLRRKEARYGVRPFLKGPYFHLVPAMWCWLQGAQFDKVLQFADADEGEVVRYFRMSAQVLREIGGAPISEGLRERVLKAARLINRGVVDAEKQLREA